MVSRFGPLPPPKPPCPPLYSPNNILSIGRPAPGMEVYFGEVPSARLYCIQYVFGVGYRLTWIHTWCWTLIQVQNKSPAVTCCRSGCCYQLLLLLSMHASSSSSRKSTNQSPERLSTSLNILAVTRSELILC